ncbi:hypothetical protein HY633_05550 [Candidatus Uhrbacteria bacterium]|nr:hypothetical protein [Candidatus Uhrbacteria bacterium]
MSLLARILGGIGAVALGLFLVMKTEWMVNNFGSVAWAEQHLGLSGGTRLFYKLLGVAIIMIGFMAATGLLSGFLRGTIGALFVPGQR